MLTKRLDWRYSAALLLIVLLMATLRPALAQTAGAACTTAGQFHESGTESLVCDAAVWKPVISFSYKGKINFQAQNDTGACTAVKTGRLRNTGAVWEYCNGTTWTSLPVALGGGTCPIAGQNPGYVCPDGTIFAGIAISPTAYYPMFTTRCDAGQTWSGSACTGAVGTYQYGSNGTARGTTNEIDGKANSATLAGFGAAAHPAAYYCENLLENGQSDWYLASPAEMDVVLSNYAAIGNFTSYGSFTFYGTTREDGTTSTFGPAVGNVQHIHYIAKTNASRVRCIRRN